MTMAIGHLRASCECDLRHRAWNPNTGRCETCCLKFEDRRIGQHQASDQEGHDDRRASILTEETRPARGHVKPRSQVVLEYAVAQGYRVTADGAAHGPRGKLAEHRRDGKGYYDFTVNHPELGRLHLMVHRLAAFQKFGAEMFQPGMEVRHRDGDKTNNSPDNMLIGTHAQNMMDRDPTARLEHAKLASKKRQALSDAQLAELRADAANGMGYEALAAKYGVSKGGAHYMVNGKKKP